MTDPVLFALLVVGTALAAIGGIAVIAYRMWREAKVEAEEFATRFPGRCVICSYHYWGVSSGIARPSPVEAHNCIEGRSHGQ